MEVTLGKYPSDRSFEAWVSAFSGKCAVWSWRLLQSSWSVLKQRLSIGNLGTNHKALSTWNLERRGSDAVIRMNPDLEAQKVVTSFSGTANRPLWLRMIYVEKV